MAGTAITRARPATHPRRRRRLTACAVPAAMPPLHAPRADVLAELEARERRLGLLPDPRTSAAMAALAAGPPAQQLYVDVLLRALGLEQCADTVVGLCWHPRYARPGPCPPCNAAGSVSQRWGGEGGRAWAPGQLGGWAGGPTGRRLVRPCPAAVQAVTLL